MSKAARAARLAVSAPCSLTPHLRSTRSRAARRPFKKELLDPQLVKMFGEGPYYGWYGVENNADVESGSKAFIEALKDPSVTFVYSEIEEALDRLEAHIEENGPYDALCGFSQGTIMITMLTARRLQRAARGEAAPPSWRCNVLIAPMPPRAGDYACIMPLPETPPLGGFPCVACMGEQDMYFEYAKRIDKLYGPQLVWMEHPGGHETPKDAGINRELSEAIWRALGWTQGGVPEPP